MSIRSISKIIVTGAALGLALLLTLHMLFFAVRSAHLLGYAYPLDYGEGPLLAQVQALRSGTPIWRLYADPDQAPYAVVNYPPVYVLTVAGLDALLPGSALLAGRIVSLVAAVSAAMALAVLVRSTDRGQETGDTRQETQDRRHKTGDTRQETQDRRHETRDTRHETAFLMVASSPGFATKPRSHEDRAPVHLLTRHLFTPSPVHLFTRHPLARHLFTYSKNRRARRWLRHAPPTYRRSALRPNNSKLKAQNSKLNSVFNPSSLLAGLVAAGMFLSIGIVREWASVMRVDMLGLSLGLWALVIVQHQRGSRPVLWAAVLLALSLLCKPTLLAAPAAAGLWLLFRSWRWALALGLLTALLLGLVVGGLQFASGGWFVLHALLANANAWDGRLAQQFWQDQMLIMRPLMLASAVGMGVTALRAEKPWSIRPVPFNIHSSLALFYTLFGLMTAFGVGKLGAYANYFLEAYAGLVYLAALGLAARQNRSSHVRQPPRLFPIIQLLFRLAIVSLLALALLRYFPLWSQEFLMPAGVIEGENPSRGSFGQRGIWQDLQREAFVLAARGRINAALNPLVQAAHSPILTDVPGVAAQAGVLSRVQMFEHRMLYEAGEWDQRALLRDLANGQPDLVVLDYLGNWMTPEMINILTRRYAQDVSVGTYSIYRPVKIGRTQSINLAFPNGLLLQSVALTQSVDRLSYAPGEIVPICLTWGYYPSGAQRPVSGQIEVVLRLLSKNGSVLVQDSRALLYGALVPADWGEHAIEHMQPLRLPEELAAGSYRLQIMLREPGQQIATAQDIAIVEIAQSGGQLPGQAGYYFVPESILAAWEQAGGYEGPGEPEMPAVPFADSVLQCFERACLRQYDHGVERVPIGEMVWLADAGFQAAAITSIQDDSTLMALWREQGGEQVLGPLLGRPLTHFGYVMQYTRFGRLERKLDAEQAGFGRVGRDVLRLPGDMPYRWP